jgi:small subunit ribosomal protein S8
MTMQDPIADMITRIRNAQSAHHETVEMPSSKQKVAIAKLLLEEGYVEEILVEEGVKPVLRLVLKYFKGEPVIELLERVSKSGLRIYRPSSDLPKVMGGLGVAVVSTSQGLMTDRQARKLGLGGEVLFFVA